MRFIVQPAARQAAQAVMRSVGAACTCPAHAATPAVAAAPACVRPRRLATPTATTDYAFEFASSSLRYGPGVTAEVGMDFADMQAQKVAVFTDNNLLDKTAVTTALQSLEAHGVNFTLFSDVRVEPNDASMRRAIAFAQGANVDAFLAIGGGSVMDTAKIANLFAKHPHKDLMDFTNAPVGGGEVVPSDLFPLIAVPTTSGTASEVTGTAIYDHSASGSKTGIAGRGLKPTLGLVDPHNVLDMPRNVAIFSGFDVVCHALESFTALPFNERSPRPARPKQRPAYQGSNPLSDVWCRESLSMFAKHFRASVEGDPEARAFMHQACSFAGMGFGNAGVHLCHGLSYPIASQVKSYVPADYESSDHAIVPHGLSVMVTAPAVFEFTAPACPERHLEAAALLGVDTTTLKADDAGRAVADYLRQLMADLGVANGLAPLGFGSEDIDSLVTGALPQQRVLKLSPNPTARESLARIYERSMEVY